ncbi:MAG: CcmD family protein [Gemmatimonadota bacterium]
MKLVARCFSALGVVSALALTAVPSLAQAGPVLAPDLRAYTFLFVAYAIVWILVFGWSVSIWLRLGRLAARLGDS